jgi:hypothetical protein
MVVGFVAGGAAGPRSGNASVLLVSDGAGSSGLGLLDLGAATVQVTGTGFNLAAGATVPSPLTLSNQREGGDQVVALTVTNTGPAGLYTEALNASFTGSTGAAFTLGGDIVDLAAGASDATSLAVGVATTSAGRQTGTVTLAYQSDGSGANGGSGLAALDIGTQTIQVSGDVFRLASASAATPSPVVLANQRVGGSLTQSLSLTNTAAADGFSEGLTASIAANGTATAGGSTGLLAAGKTSSALFVGVDTSSAGAKSGVATLTLTSDGTGTSGFGSLALGTQLVDVSGDVFRLANPVVDATPVILAARVGDAAPVLGIAVTNSSPDIYTERLNATIGTTVAAFAGSGSINGLTPGESSNALAVALDTQASGSVSGFADVSLISSGAGTTGAPDAALPGAQVALTGRVYAPAVVQVANTVVDFGIVRVGDAVAARGITVANTANGALNDTLRTTASASGAPFTTSGEIAALVAGESDGSAITVQLDTGSAGGFSGGTTLTFTSRNPDLADLGLGSADVTLLAQVNRLAQVELVQAGGDGSFQGGGASYTLDFGTLVEGSAGLLAALDLGNVALAPADDLAGSFDVSALVAGDPFVLTGFESFTGLAAGGTLSGLSIGFGSGSIGSFDRVIVLQSLSTNGSGPDLTLGDVSLRLQGTVVAVPEPSTYLMMAIGLLGLAGLARRRRRAGEARHLG